MHADLKRVIESWRALYIERGGVPHLRDLDLMKFYDIADRMIVADRVGRIPDETYRWRFAGSTMRDIWDMELTGKTLHETHDAATTRAAVEVYRNMASNGLPHFWTRPAGVIHEDRSYIHYARAVMPLANDAGELAHFLGIYVFYRNVAERAAYDEMGRVVRLSLPEKIDS